ncbi:MAG: helix-turn-helix transcriptional regulator [Planctomycetes bacterium]|nr:helix-turn-helix transcriptional regulator [Planctomycetota bacterium]
MRIGHAKHGHNGPEQYYFDDIWCLHLYSNSFELGIDEQRYQIQPGDVSLIPPGKQMIYDFKNRSYTHYYCLFKSDAEEFPDQMHFRLHADTLKTCTHIFQSAANKQHLGKERKQAAIWEILWQLQENHEQGPANPVAQAQHIISASLNKDLQVSAIAREVNISGNQLTRLFRKELGMTVIAYIRQQRMQLAKQLIQETELPIKRIAQECGMNDLQYFNKTVHAFYNCSPRMLRQQ